MVFPPHPLNSVRPRVRVRVRVTITLRPNNVWEERENSTSTASVPNVTVRILDT